MMSLGPLHRVQPRAVCKLFATIIVLLGAIAQCAASGEKTALECETIVVFVSASCPHCADAKAFLSDLGHAEPRLRVDYREVTDDSNARQQFFAFVERHGIERPGVPTFDICGRVLVGFDSDKLLTSLYDRDDPKDAASIELPLLGDLSPAALGLPAFTIAIGLVDGFNPCAMWVLLFLLSILVNVKRRSRIILVAGTFVLVSGLTYFAFMAAWLNAFLILGYSRVLQLILGGLAILVGSVHLKDFFALHRGLSLSIPDSVKPQIYERVRRVVRAENAPVALAGTIALAVLVNFVELLCTAGLPALYTQILSGYALSDAGYYAYLALYNLAYIADDGVMVAIAVITLGHRRLQEHEARWLKLLSGGLIIGLGAILILAPHILAF